MPEQTIIGQYKIPSGEHQTVKCSSCGAEIIFIRTARGFSIPISVASIVTNEAGEKVGITHFADCPYAKSHRHSDLAHTRRIEP